MLATERFRPPAPNEIEISLFGPGYGECLAIHLGESEWLIVDSCLDKNAQPTAISYLQSIGVNPRQQVKWIFATHWHDDHIRGLSNLVQECVSAQFGCSTALRKSEFLNIIAAMENRGMMSTTGVTEFSKVFNILESRKLKGDPAGTPLWAIESRLLWRRNTGTDFEIHALSPSDANVSLALNHLGRLFPKIGTPKRRIPALTPNHASVVLWIRAGKLCILLGADLEETHDAGRGWSALIASTTRPAGKAFVFKIPHHGSDTAELPAVWTDLLHDNPIAMLTLFAKGNVRLPTEDDVARICSRTKHAFATGVIKNPPSPKRSPMVTRTIRETVKKIAPVYSIPGQIRLRAAADLAAVDPWSLELFNGALSLHEPTATKKV